MIQKINYVCTFAITGFLIFHPELRAFANYLEDPAHNDIEDVEVFDDITKLREEMIDMAANTLDEVEVGKKSNKSSVILNQGHNIAVDMDYYFTAIRKTFFS